MTHTARRFALVPPILVIDDDPDLLDLLSLELGTAGFDVTTGTSLAALKAALATRDFAYVLLDLFLGEESAETVLPYLAREAPYAQVIVMTAHGSITRAVAAMQRGASSFVCKSEDVRSLTREIMSQLRSVERRKEAELSSHFEDLGLVGKSPAMHRLFADILQMTSSEAAVLIQGESGTGKELVARAIHKLSRRREAPFAAINCAAIPEPLLESELFGHRRGAFTDAKTDRKGIFESCTTGTLFLDEIGDMPVQLQAKLLRVLQEREVLPLGATRAIPIQTRVISATHRELEKEIGRGRFREDLYFRIHVLTLSIPPLRERKADIPLLTHTFIQRFNRQYGKNVRLPNPEICAKIAAYDWPGNVRELQNAMERAVVLAKGEELAIEDILALKTGKKWARRDDADFADEGLLSYAEAKEHFERTFILRILDKARGSVSEAARLSGRYRSDIYRLIERYEINVEAYRH